MGIEQSNDYNKQLEQAKREIPRLFDVGRSTLAAIERLYKDSLNEEQLIEVQEILERLEGFHRDPFRYYATPSAETEANQQSNNSQERLEKIKREVSALLDLTRSTIKRDIDDPLFRDKLKEPEIMEALGILKRLEKFHTDHINRGASETTS